MHTSVFKALGALIVLAAAWIDANLSPLFYILVALVLVDIFIHARDAEAHYKKLIAMAVSLGLPAFLASHVATDLFSPEVLKVIVAMLCLCYVQIVIPDVVKVLKRVFPKESVLIDAGANAVEQKIETEAKAAETK